MIRIPLVDFGEIQEIDAHFGDLVDVPGTIPPDVDIVITRKGQPVLRQTVETGPGGETTTTREVINRPTVNGEVVEERRVTVETRAPKLRSK